MSFITVERVESATAPSARWQLGRALPRFSVHLLRSRDYTIGRGAGKTGDSMDLEAEKGKTGWSRAHGAMHLPGALHLHAGPSSPGAAAGRRCQVPRTLEVQGTIGLGAMHLPGATHSRSTRWPRCPPDLTAPTAASPASGPLPATTTATLPVFSPSSGTIDVTVGAGGGSPVAHPASSTARNRTRRFPDPGFSAIMPANVAVAAPPWGFAHHHRRPHLVGPKPQTAILPSPERWRTRGSAVASWSAMGVKMPTGEHRPDPQQNGPDHGLNQLAPKPAAAIDGAIARRSLP